MTNEHTTLNSLFTDIADSIRAKTGSEDSIKADNFPSAIMDIPTASGGLHLDTELILTADTTETVGPVTLTAVLTANYDDITPSDVDLHGFLEGATITFYDENGTSLYSGITNQNGEITTTINITEDTILHALFTGTSDYDSCTSNILEIKKLTPIFIDDMVGNPLDKYEILINDGLLEYRTEGNDKILFAQTINNTEFVVTPNINPILSDSTNFALECDWKFSNMWNGGGITFVKEDKSIPTLEDKLFDFYNYGSGDNVPFKFQSSTNEYHHLKLVYNDDIFSCWVDDISLGTYTNQKIGKIGLRFGGDRSNFYFYVKNLIIYK